MNSWYRAFAARLRHDLARERVRPGAGAWLLSGALGFALAALGLWLQGGYHAAFTPLHTLLTRLPDDLWALLSSLGYENLALTGVLVAAPRHPRFLWILLWTAVVDLAFTQGLKYGLDLTRPPGVMADLRVVGPHLVRHGFPSGHTGLAFAVAGSALAFTRSARGRAGWLLLALGVGLSRVAVGVHWPLDVLVGAAGGLASAWAGLRLTQRFGDGPTPAATLALLLLLAVFPLRILNGQTGGFSPLDPLLHLLALAGLGATAAALLSIGDRSPAPPTGAGG